MIGYNMSMIWIIHIVCFFVYPWALCLSIPLHVIQKMQQNRGDFAHTWKLIKADIRRLLGQEPNVDEAESDYVKGARNVLENLFSEDPVKKATAVITPILIESWNEQGRMPDAKHVKSKVKHIKLTNEQFKQALKQAMLQSQKMLR